jgi:hypothetical protein
MAYRSSSSFDYLSVEEESRFVVQRHGEQAGREPVGHFFACEIKDVQVQDLTFRDWAVVLPQDHGHLAPEADVAQQITRAHRVRA